MSYRTILVYLDCKERAASILKVATGLAQLHNAHLIGLYVVPSLEIYVSTELAIPVTMTDNHNAYHRGLCDELQAMFESATANQDYVAEWREISAAPLSVADTVTEVGHTVDLVILSQNDADATNDAQHDLPESVVLSCSRPVLIVPVAGEFTSTGTEVFVAWDGGNEATRAVFDALPVLRDANSVVVHTVNPKHFERHRLLSMPAELVNTLSRHGVNVTLSQSDARSGEVGDEIVQYVKDTGANLLVMGAYGRSRLRERLFGGTTRTVFNQMMVPVLMSH